MNSSLVKASIVAGLLMLVSPVWAFAQCQRQGGAQSPGNSSALTSTAANPYALNGLGTNYTQNPLNSGYNLNTMQAMQQVQYSRTYGSLAAARAQTQTMLAYAEALRARKAAAAQYRANTSGSSERMASARNREANADVRLTSTK